MSYKCPIVIDVTYVTENQRGTRSAKFPCLQRDRLAAVGHTVEDWIRSCQAY